jgi:DENN domain-containing protein 11
MNISGVEFKSMPSGLHNVTDDLVYTHFWFEADGGDRYFVMPPYAGLSAYYKKEASEDERNARMVAIGVLVPATGRYGRLGRAWDHASPLKYLAR